MLKCLWSIYYDGLSNLPRWAKVLLLVVAAKLFIMFVVFKGVLMPDFLDTNYETEEEKSEHVWNELILKPEI